VRITWITLLALVSGSVAGPVRADETPVKSKIVAVDLFKNGLAVVRREVTLGKAGAYLLDDVPSPVHGTYWIESPTPVESVVQMREVEIPTTEASLGNLQEVLAGKKVTIHFKGEKMPPVSGMMVRFKESKSGETPPRDTTEPATQPARFLVVQTAKGRSYLDSYEVASIETDSNDDKVRRRRPRLVLTLGETDRAETPVRISYLAHGLGWAPAYKIDISDPKTLVLEQQAVLKNELANLDGVEMQLISGFPNVQFANVVSPLSARTSWASFFQELNQFGRRQPDVSGNGVVYQQAVMFNAAAPALTSPVATPSGEGVDLHYQSIGKRTLANGDALAVNVAKGRADYERIVEWLIPDTRDEWGRNSDVRGRGDDSDESAWDALKFKNPLAFPMTTGPAMITSGGRFNGQSTSYWVNAGEETVVRVGKALSIRTRSVEHDERKSADDTRTLVWIGGRQFRTATVEGELAVSNHRAEAVRLVIRRRISGELQSADGNPKTSLREEGIYSVNRHSELLWNLPLKAGEDRVLKYRYTVLVAN
jgi:hypothetical protein